MVVALMAIVGRFYQMNQMIGAMIKRILILFNIGEHRFNLPDRIGTFNRKEYSGWLPLRENAFPRFMSNGKTHLAFAIQLFP